MLYQSTPPIKTKHIAPDRRIPVFTGFLDYLLKSDNHCSWKCILRVGEVLLFIGIQLLSAFPPFFLSVMLSTPNSSPCMMKTITTLPLRSSHPLIMLTPQNSHSFFLQECHSLFSCPCYSYKYFLHCLWKVQSEKNFWEQRAVENNWAVSPKVKYRITGWLSNSILSMFFRRNNYTFPQKRIHTWMFIVTNRWKQPKFSSTDDRYIKHDVATQRNIIQPWKGTKRW